MTKYTSYLLLCGLLLLGSCQSVELLSIDYMTPAEVSFPTVLKRVGIVNNMPSIPDNRLITSENTPAKNEYELARQTSYYNGDSQLATESLAKAIAKENYFDEVIIGDTMLRAKDITPRENTLAREEVNQLIRQLNVDLLISLENVQMRSIRKVSYLPEWGIYQALTDVKVYPSVRVYLPNRQGPLVTLNTNDSIFWEESGTNEAYARSRLIKEEEMIAQASEFAGTVPVKHLLPYWSTEERYLFVGGSVEMRDAAVFAKGEKWEKAIALWKNTYQQKKGKPQMRAAHNIAVGYEMLDSLEEAGSWELKAQALAFQIEKVEEIKEAHTLELMSIPNYLMMTRYLATLQKRSEGMTRLRMQMQRFTDDF